MILTIVATMATTTTMTAVEGLVGVQNPGGVRNRPAVQNPTIAQNQMAVQVLAVDQNSAIAQILAVVRNQATKIPRRSRLPCQSRKKEAPAKYRMEIMI